MSAADRAAISAEIQARFKLLPPGTDLGEVLFLFADVMRLHPEISEEDGDSGVVEFLRELTDNWNHGLH